MTQLTDSEISIVAAAKELLLDPGRCVFGAPACDDAGNRVKPTDPRATHWCMVGAMAKYSPGGLIPYNILRHIDECIVPFEPVLSQDFTFSQLYDQTFSHERVLEFIDFMLSRAAPTPIPTVQRFPDAQV